MSAAAMKTMTRSDFLTSVKEDSKGVWPGGDMLAGELAMHLPESEKVVAWIWLKGHRTRTDSRDNLALLTERHFLLVEILQSGSQFADDDSRHTSVLVESVPLGRLRSIHTSNYGDGRGSFSLDFAGPVFGDSFGSNSSGNQIFYTLDKGWPDEEAAAFLAAIASVRK